jgi:hypothetical protein
MELFSACLADSFGLADGPLVTSAQSLRSREFARHRHFWELSCTAKQPYDLDVFLNAHFTERPQIGKTCHSRPAILDGIVFGM